MPVSKKRKKKRSSKSTGPSVEFKYENPRLVSMRNTLNHLEQIEQELRQRQLEETEENKNGR